MHDSSQMHEARLSPSRWPQPEGPCGRARESAPDEFTFDITPAKQVVRATVEAHFRIAPPDLARIEAHFEEEP